MAVKKKRAAKQQQGNGASRILTAKNKNPRNPRLISDEALEKLRLALERFGDLGGIVLNRRTGHLVGGHQRIDAFKEQRIAAVIERQLPKPDRTGTLAYGHIEMFGTRYAYREVDWDEKVELA